MAQFLKIIYIGIFKYFLAAGSIKKGLFGLVSTYYEMVETNGQKILYLHYFVWICGVFYLTKICNWLQFDLYFVANIVEFIDTIIYWFIANILLSKVMHEEVLLAVVLLSKNISYKGLLASFNKINKEFVLKSYKNSNTVAFKMQIYSFFHNAICFKYSVVISEKY